MAQPRLDEVRGALEALAPELAPALARDRGIGRQRVPREHAVGPLRHVHRDHQPAAVVHVVGVAIVARVDRDRRRRAPAGVRAASWSPLKPLHDVPTMPTLPSHHGCAAIQAITSRPSSCSCSEYSSSHRSARVAGAADVDAHRRVAVPGEPAHLLVVARLGAVAQPVGQVLEDRRLRAGVDRQPHARGQPGAVRERRSTPSRAPEPRSGRSSRVRAAIERGYLTREAGARTVKACDACSPACSLRPPSPQRRTPVRAPPAWSSRARPRSPSRASCAACSCRSRKRHGISVRYVEQRRRARARPSARGQGPARVLRQRGCRRGADRREGLARADRAPRSCTATTCSSGPPRSRRGREGRAARHRRRAAPGRDRGPGRQGRLRGRRRRARRGRAVARRQGHARRAVRAGRRALVPLRRDRPRRGAAQHRDLQARFAALLRARRSRRAAGSAGEARNARGPCACSSRRTPRARRAAPRRSRIRCGRT